MLKEPIECPATVNDKCYFTMAFRTLGTKVRIQQLTAKYRIFYTKDWDSEGHQISDWTLETMGG